MTHFETLVFASTLAAATVGVLSRNEREAYVLALPLFAIGSALFQTIGHASGGTLCIGIGVIALATVWRERPYGIAGAVAIVLASGIGILAADHQYWPAIWMAIVVWTLMRLIRHILER